MLLLLAEAQGTATLFFRVEEQDRVDLEVAARTAIAWSQSLKAAARALDPESELEVDLVDADEGSLLVNAVLRWVKSHLDPVTGRFERGYKRLPRTLRIAISASIFLAVDGWPTLERYLTDHDWSDKDRAELHAAVAAIQSDHDFVARQREVFRQAEKDRAIQGLGAKPSPTEAVAVEVPRSHFAEAGGLFADREADDQTRTTSSVVEVILVKPALIAAPRTWTFEQTGLGRFEAIMNDAAVLNAMRNGGLPERLREGIPMKLRLDIHEVAKDGEWRVARGGRVVSKVLSPDLDGN